MPVKRPRYDAWDSERVRALRHHLGYTQQQLSEQLGTRQQTVSEWETGVYQPRGTSARLLSLIAEQAGFRYHVGGQRGRAPEPGPAPERNGEREREAPVRYRVKRNGPPRERS